MTPNTRIMEIKLEDNTIKRENEMWEDAKTRLTVASEVLGFPFAIVMDETALAYRDFTSMWAYKILMGEATTEDFAAMWRYWAGYSKTVHSMEEAERVLYPWFHDGEEIYYDPMDDTMGRNL